jgi:hypothetical protein
MHHVLEGRFGPGGVGLGEEGGDLIGVGVPGGFGSGDGVVAACLGGGDDVAGSGDMAAQQGGELDASVFAVVTGDGVADIGLVLQEPAERCVAIKAARRPRSR